MPEAKTVYTTSPASKKVARFTPGPDAELIALCQDAIEACRWDNAAHDAAPSDATLEDEYRAAVAAQPYRRRFQEIEAQVVAMPARTGAGIRAKAKMAAAWWGTAAPEGAELAASIVADLTRDAADAQ